MDLIVILKYAISFHSCLAFVLSFSSNLLLILYLLQLQDWSEINQKRNFHTYNYNFLVTKAAAVDNFDSHNFPLTASKSKQPDAELVCF